MDNKDEAKEYGIDHLPTLVYFENKIPALYEGKWGHQGEGFSGVHSLLTKFCFLGDLMNEDEVLKWLVQQKHSATIEEVTDEILKELVEEHEYVVVYFSKVPKPLLSDKRINIRQDLHNGSCFQVGNATTVRTVTAS